MKEKPKRWTWEYVEATEDSHPDEIYFSDKEIFELNEPLIEWQEKRIKELKISEEHLVILKHKRDNQIKILRKALEFYADHKSDKESDLERYPDDSYIAIGKKARTALREAFPGEYDE